jgi:hypothetical protein
LLSATSINGILRSLHNAMINFLYACSLHDWDKTQSCAVPRSKALTASNKPRAKPSWCKEVLTTARNASNGVYWVAGATSCGCSLQGCSQKRVVKCGEWGLSWQQLWRGRQK